MCTAIRYVSGDLYFGRTLDNDFSYKEEAVIMPRRRKLSFRNEGTLAAHNAILGIAYVVDNYPLFYDACNDKGLAAAGLNYVGNAVYRPSVGGKHNVAQFELVPWILAKCNSVEDARKLLENTNVTDDAFSDSLPPAQLHWMIADKNSAIVVECDIDGMHIYDNEIGVLTNNPPFPMQRFALNNYMCLSPDPPVVGFSDKIELSAYSRGMGAMGLPGDLSSQSRFVRAAFTLLNSPPCRDCTSSVSQFFHILGTVEQTRGSCVLQNGECETTVYTSCINADKGVLYYTSYDNRRISAVDMHKVNLDGCSLVRYPMVHGEQIFMQN